MFPGIPTNYQPEQAQQAAQGDLALAQQNQSFWDNWAQTFNPQQQVMSTPSSAPAYAQNAQNAQAQGQAAAAIAPSGSFDVNGLQRNLGNQDLSRSRTEDLNSFLQNMQQNQQTSNQRETSMFGNAENMNQATQNLKQQVPLEGNLSEAENADKTNSMWQNYYDQNGGAGNSLGSAVGGFFGHLFGNKAGGNNPGLPDGEQGTQNSEDLMAEYP